MLIDGPFGWGRYKYTRVQALVFSEKELLSDSSIMIMHDSQRKSTRRTIRLFEESLKRHGYRIKSKEVYRKDSDKEMTVLYIVKQAAENV